MKLTVEKDELIRAVTPAMGSVSNKATIPAIEGILFNAVSDSECEIVAYDLEKAFKKIIACRIELLNGESNNFVLNAGKINQIIKTLPDGLITIEVNDRLVSKISSGRSEFELHALDGKDFPDLPELSGDIGFSISQSVLSKMIRDTQFAIAVNDPRAALNGLYFLIKGSAVTIVSCDGNRLAFREQKCELGDTDLSFIIPGKTINELMRLVDSKDDEKNVRIMVGRKHVIFAFEDFYFLSRLIEGEYIEYERIIPKMNKTHVKINREDFIQSLERASLVTEDRTMGQTRSSVILVFEDDVLQISAKSISGRVYDEVNTEMDGEGLRIGFNCRFLLDALRSTDVEFVKLSMSSPLMSMIIEAYEPVDDENFLFLVLPVKIKD